VKCREPCWCDLRYTTDLGSEAEATIEDPRKRSRAGNLTGVRVEAIEVAGDNGTKVSNACTKICGREHV
jgi:hypothetical protein